ncbi:hypothetical protein AL00_06140 [Sphingobium indicum F2]|uniref:Uncharacterized protein n=1 Tax=Sphingobium indicum F2 TaxID=1450518 RepID=A0A8E1C3M9_9SPHN|nr:hypothetical protein AL00_06140 [Sphingobium indicum F2]
MRLRSALERLDRNFKLLLEGRPVRDVAETDAEVRAALSTVEPAGNGREAMTPEEAWQELVEYDDRTSPEEYPDMALITFEELRAFMGAASGATPPAPALDGVSLARDRVIMSSVRLGKWMSAALDDPNVCEEMKADIRDWFSAGEPVEGWGAALSSPSEGESEPASSGEMQVTKEWCLNMAALEDGEIGAGMPDHPLRTPATEGVTMTEDQIKHMAERFLGWKLPPDFSPDGGISFNAIGNPDTQYEYRHEPVGTNLLNYEQALAMVRYLAEGLPIPQSASLSHDAEGESATVSREANWDEEGHTADAIRDAFLMVGKGVISFDKSLDMAAHVIRHVNRFRPPATPATSTEPDTRAVCEQCGKLGAFFCDHVGASATSTERGR